MADTVELRCPNTSCRILTFVGVSVKPFMHCPVCQFVGILTSDVPVPYGSMRMPVEDAREKYPALTRIEPHTYLASSDDGWCAYVSSHHDRDRCGLPPGHACHSAEAL